MIVRELLTRLGFQVDETGAEKYENTLGRVRRMSLGMKVGLGIATAAATFMAGRFASIADRMTDYTSRVKLAIGANEDLEGTMSRLTDLAQFTYSSFDQTAEAFLSNNTALKQLGYTTEDVFKFTQTLNDALVVSGTKGDDAAAVMQNLQRAMTMGVLKGDQFNAVQMRGGKIMELLRRRFGKTDEELRQLASDGEITSKVLYETLIEAMGELREQAEDMPQTFADARQNLQTEVNRTVDLINKATGATTLMAAGVDQVRFAIEDWTPTLIEAINWVNQFAADLGGWEPLLKTAASGIAAIASLAVLANFRTLVRLLGLVGTRLTALIMPAIPIAIAVTIAGMAIDDFMLWLEGKDSVFGQLFGDVEEHTEAVRLMGEAWTQVLEGDIPRGLATAGAAFDAWAVKAKPHAQEAFGNFGQELGKEVLRLLGEDWTNIQNIFWDTILFFKQRWAAFTGWFDTIWANTTAAFDEVWANSTAALETAWNAVAGVFDSTITNFKTDWESFTGLLSSSFQAAVDLIKRIWGGFKTWWGDNMPAIPEWLGGTGGMTPVPGGQVYNPNDYAPLPPGITTTPTLPPGDPDAPFFEPRSRVIEQYFPSSSPVTNVIERAVPVAFRPDEDGRIAGLGKINDAGVVTPPTYQPPESVRGGPRAGNNINVDLTGMAFNVTTPPGTSEDQAREIHQSLEANVTRVLERAVRSAMSDFPDAEEA